MPRRILVGIAVKMGRPKPSASHVGPPSTELSRAISHALRHEPWLYELELDAQGWADLEQLLLALRQKGGAWTELRREHIEEMIEKSEKKRHELRGRRIRASYGHSVPGRLQRVRGVPPAELFHGTAPDTAEIILRDGLLPMGRQFVHLSVDRETALAVGRRKDRSPILLTVTAEAAHRHGVAFYRGNENVWLADVVPADFIEAAERRPGPEGDR